MMMLIAVLNAIRERMVLAVFPLLKNIAPRRNGRVIPNISST
jgi:hypothetical protein